MSSETVYHGKEVPDCQLCSGKPRKAAYDGKVKGHTSWAYLCEACFQSFGVGLGTGKGQKLIFETETDTSPSVQTLSDNEKSTETVPPNLPEGLTLDMILEAAEESIYGTEDLGYCLSCGHEHDGCEPDARRYTCEECGKRLVFGVQELLMMFG